MTDVNPTSVICVTMPFPTVFLSLTWVEFLLSRKAFIAESVYVYTYEMFTELRKRRYLGKTSQSKHGNSQNVCIQQQIYLTIIPRVRMGYESIAHEAEGRMGYWLMAHEGEWNNCFSKIKLVRQK